MDCTQSTPRLSIETDQTVYEIEFGQIQIEITGRCNMRCRHCRAAGDLQQDMPVSQILKIIRFARQFSPDYKEVVISGGEPLLHRAFPRVLAAVRENGGSFVTLTTNGSCLTEEHLNLVRSLGFQRLTLSVSLDSLNPEEHDSFRGFDGAHALAIRAIKLVVEADVPGVVSSVRMTIRPDQIGELDEMVAFVHGMGCRRVSISGVQPSGRGAEDTRLWMTRDQKRQFIEKIYELKATYPPAFQVGTNDPLKCLVRGFHDFGGDGEIAFDGCPAAAVTFNVNANGNMTPCALLNLPMMNVFPLSVEEITHRYQESAIVKNMLEMNLGGKCGGCSLKYQCGGCRARALARNGDYLAEDPDCWI